ncbi:hypothetical protein [Actinomadura madurae]|uniref:hypothetical protein n=1 Tax=Actinomadura madurae TaxID=1993 RepID=UPI003FD8E114
MVPPRRDRARAPHLPRRPHRAGRADGRARRAPGRLHARRRLGGDRRGDRAAPLPHLGDRAHRGAVRVRAARAVRTALPHRGRRRAGTRAGPGGRADPLDIARDLAGWGGRIDVLEPPSVRDELARIGTELAARYAGED